MAATVLCYLTTASILAWVAHGIKADLRAWLHHLDTAPVVIVAYPPDYMTAGERLKWAARYEILAGGIVAATLLWAVEAYYVLKELTIAAPGGGTADRPTDTTR